jgi:flagellar biosynthesis protein FlhA
MLSLALIPGLPKGSFFLMAALLVGLARRASAQQERRAAEIIPPSKVTPQEKLEALLHLDDLALEVGPALVPLVDEKQGGQLLARIRALRRHLALQLGFIVPSVHITDNLRLNPREYVVRLRGVEIARWEMVQDCLLAISSEASAQPLEGKETLEPAFQVAAKWIAPTRRERALAAGYAVVDQTSVLATHLAELIKQHAHELLTRQETKRLLDSLSERQPKLVEELVPKLMSLGEVQKVLQQLLREQVSIRDLTSILEALQDVAATTKNLVLWVEAVRQTLGRALVPSLVGDDKKLTVVQVDVSVEDQINQAFEPQGSAARLGGLEPALLRRVVDTLRSFVGEQFSASSPVLLCNSPARFHLRRLLEPFLPRLVVLSPAEIPAAVTVQSVGVLR